MIKMFIKRKLDSLEKELGVPVDESRYMAEHNVPALLAFNKVVAIAQHRRILPAAVYYIAKIASYRQEDCGTCVQIAVNQARSHGVSTAVIQAALDRRLNALSPELQMIYRFAEGQANREDDPDTRQRIIDRYGHAGLIELALAITSTRTFPTLKRILGYAKSCSRIKVAV